MWPLTGHLDAEHSWHSRSPGAHNFSKEEIHQRNKYIDQCISTKISAPKERNIVLREHVVRRTGRFPVVEHKVSPERS